MTDTVIQTSFHAGEWAPALNARVDLEKYRAAVALGTNFFVDYRGGLSSRTGTRFITYGYDPNEVIRIIPFQASAEVSYVLEFGHLYLRFINNGAPVLLPALNITGITQASPAVVSVVNSIALGNVVYISGVLGMTELNDRYFKVIGQTAGTISLGDVLTGLPIDSSGFNAYISGGTVSEQYLISTPYDADDLALLKFTQNVDKMILTHSDYPAKVLTLVSATSWTLTDIVYGPGVNPPATPSVTPINLAADATGVIYGYTVSAVNANGEEGTAPLPVLTSQIEDMRTTEGSNLLGWAGVAGAASYNVYKAWQGHSTVPVGAAYGFIGNVTGLSYLDTNNVPDFSQTLQVSFNPFPTFPPAVPAYYQQRLWLAGPSNDVQAFHATQPGTDYNFNFTRPSLPDNGISGRLVSQQLNTIRAMIPAANGLIILTDRLAWLVNAGEGGNSPVTPATIIANEQAFNGISNVPPIKANYDILYVQAKGSSVRNLSYKFETNVFTGQDISILSSHLFTGKVITEWAWAEEPFKVVWAVRNDGVMLTLTFLKEQELIGWTHSVTDGTFESVCVVTEGTNFGDVDAVYAVVRREVNGIPRRMIERVAERIFPNGREDAWCVDSGLSYEGAPATSFSGFYHLADRDIVGLADGVPFEATVDANGNFTIASAASKVIAGLPFTPEFQTLRLDTGLPTVQGKPKKIAAETVRVQDTLGIQIGSTFDTLVDMQGLVVGNLNEQDNTVVTDLYTGDARTQLDPNWTTQGQICIRQPLPYPVTILGVIPEFEVAETDA